MKVTFNKSLFIRVMKMGLLRPDGSGQVNRLGCAQMVDLSKLYLDFTCDHCNRKWKP